MFERGGQPLDELRPRPRHFLPRQLALSVCGAQPAEDLAVRNVRGARPVDRARSNAERLGDRRAIALVVDTIRVSQRAVDIKDREPVHSAAPEIRAGE
jgi:hypothetical protein